MQSALKCLASGVDVSELLLAIDSRQDVWHEITGRQDAPGSPHQDTKAIFLRWSQELTVHACFNDLIAIDYPALEIFPEARPLIAMIAKEAGALSIARAMVVSLRPGGKISPHVDDGLYADTYERFHLVMQSDFGNRFFVGKPYHYECAEMRSGDLWWFNHKRTHWVENKSNRDRLHMIVDMKAPYFHTEREAC